MGPRPAGQNSYWFGRTRIRPARMVLKSAQRSLRPGTSAPRYPDPADRVGPYGEVFIQGLRYGIRDRPTSHGFPHGTNGLLNDLSGRIRGVPCPTLFVFNSGISVTVPCCPI